MILLQGFALACLMPNISLNVDWLRWWWWEFRIWYLCHSLFFIISITLLA